MYRDIDMIDGRNISILRTQDGIPTAAVTIQGGQDEDEEL